LPDQRQEDLGKSRNIFGQLFRTQDDELIRDGDLEVLLQDNVEFEYIANYPSLLSIDNLDHL